jgi:hypothetical protein
MHFEAGRFENIFEHPERAGIGRGYRRAADEVAGDGKGGKSISHAPA